MILNEKFNISEGKVAELFARIKSLGINPSDIDESFVRGSGRGGQKINKTSNCVQLHHRPTGIRVSCQRERERNKNRFIALRELVDKIEMLIRPETSQRLNEIAKIRKQKDRRRRR